MYLYVTPKHGCNKAVVGRMQPIYEYSLVKEKCANVSALVSKTENNDSRDSAVLLSRSNDSDISTTATSEYIHSCTGVGLTFSLISIVI